VVIVSVGDDLETASLVTLICKEMGCKYVLVKAASDLQAKVLYKIGADRVILPEQDMGIRVAHNLVASNILDFIELSSEYSMMEIKPLDEWHNKSLKDIRIRADYGINVVAIKTEHNINVSPSADYVIKDSDVLVALGSSEDLSRFESMIGRKVK
jgi:trk system potassium uptake protein TrkA